MLERLPLVKQIAVKDPLALGRAARSRRSAQLTARIADADRMVQSVCPYCAVGCGQRVYVKDERVIQIEGDPDSPVSRGRLCPKGSASLSLVTSDRRQQHVLYRRPYANQWVRLDLETAMDMIADRVVAAREATWQEQDDKGRPLRRT